METFPPQLTEQPIFRDLARTRALARLHDIAFLGALDRFHGSNELRAGSRFEHTVGVTYLAHLASMELEEGERSLAIAAAMIHDIGHGPLSHSTEGFFKTRFSIDHRIIGIKRLQKDRELRSVLERHGIEFTRVVNLAFGKTPDPLSFIFHYPVNVDTIEGITRSAEYFGIFPLPDRASVVQLLVTPDDHDRPPLSGPIGMLV